MLFRLLLHLLAAAVVYGACPAGTTSSTNFNKCYLYVKTPKPFLLAEEYCQSYGGHLVTIQNGFENSFVSQLPPAGTDFWIGASLLLSSKWSWTTNQTIGYTNWAGSQPADPSNMQCTSERTSDGLWTKQFCYTSNSFICETSSNFQLATCPAQTILNIPSNPSISPTDSQKYPAYQQALAEFQYSVDFTADPCNDFYNYACGNYRKPVSISDMMSNNYGNMIGQLTSPAYQSTIQGSTALQKEQTFYTTCVATANNGQADNKTLVDNNYLRKKVDYLATILGSPFTTVFGGTTKFPTPYQLANALGYLSFSEGIDTYITPYVDTYWKDNTKGNLLFIDQNTAELSKTYYAPKAFATIEQSYIASTTGALMEFCIEQGQACPGLKDKVTQLILFEQNLAYNYSTDDNTRRQAARSWNLMDVNALNQKYKFIDWPTYLQTLPSVALGVVNTPGYQLDIMEDAMLSALSSDISKFGSDNVVNYLYMRLILDSAQYLPSYQSAYDLMPKLSSTPKLGKDRSDRRQIRKQKKITKNPSGADYSGAEYYCISLTDELLQYANGRVFIDKIYPDDASRKAIRATAGGLITNIVHSFQGMLEQLDWMTDASKSKALDKTMGIVKNIAFPDWITDATKLDLYYNTLDLKSGNPTFYDMWDRLIQFNLYLEYKNLGQPADRTDFQAGPGIVNAWYQPEYNSITLAAGMLQPPFFQQNFPAAVNYGGIGIVSGHELTHGFDDQGVQWGPTGNLPDTPWMDQNSTLGFQNMANCVINEYNGFCPLDPKKYTPNCINGVQTQGENIADNGGIHSAFRAYRTHIQLDGPDPTLPDALFGTFTSDQLFFLNYGQIWCENPVPDDSTYKQLMTDPHSPALYRVFGTIMNFPAFRVAYNCPAGSKYGPVDHCKVWVPNTEA